MALVGCGSTSKPEITVIKFCDALKTFAMETAATCFVSEDVDIEGLVVEENTDNTEFMACLKKWSSELTYTVGTTDVKGDITVVPVDFTYVDVSTIFAEAIEEYMFQALVLAFSGAEDAELEDLFGYIFMGKAETVSTETTTITVEFECIKKGNKWVILELSDDADYKISNIISSNMIMLMDTLEEG